MSTILDALKKSEQERKQNDVPTLMTMEAPQEKSALPWVLVVFLFAALALLVWLLMGKTNKDDQLSAVSKEQSEPSNTTNPELSDILINAISYAEQEDKRVVMVNGELFRQGDTIREGLTVTSILQGSVTFDLNGKSFTKTP